MKKYLISYVVKNKLFGQIIENDPVEFKIRTSKHKDGPYVIINVLEINEK